MALARLHEAVVNSPLCFIPEPVDCWGSCTGLFFSQDLGTLYDHDAPAGVQHIFLVTVNIISYIQSTVPHLST